jgi:hypothetical protein
MGACNTKRAIAAAAIGPLSLLPGLSTSCGKPKPEVLIQSVNDIVSQSIVTTLNSCQAYALASETIDITCKPVITGVTFDVYEGNPACRACMDMVFTGLMDQHELEQEQWVKGPATVRLNINDEYTLMKNRLEECGLTACKACVLSNSSQASFIDEKNNCMADDSFTTAVQNEIGSNIATQLSSNQDVLSGVADALGNKDLTSITTTLKSQISNVVTTNFLKTMLSSIQTSQSIVVNANGSTRANVLVQSSTFAMVSSYVTSQQVATKVFSDEFTQYVSNVALSQSTLDNVGAIFADGGTMLAKTLDSIVGKILLAVLIFLAIIVLFIVGMLFYRMFRNLSQKNQWKNTTKTF